MFSGRLFSKIITASASIVVASCLTLTTVFILNDSNAIDLKDENVHKYQANFYVDDTLVFSDSYIKGEYVSYAFQNIPVKDQDADGTMYLFTGWDLLNNGMVDIFPAAIYSNINAHAVFTPYTLPELDLSKIDLYQLLQLLEDLDIDLESFINFFGLDLEDLLELLKVDVFSYTSDYDGIAYFRNESFGNYNSQKNKWNDANYFNYPGFVDRTNPLNFTSDIIKQNQNPYTFNISYNKGGKKFPVLSYELNAAEDLETDAYSLTNPVDKKYTSVGYPYLPATNYTIQLGKNYSFTSDEIRQDEQAYRDYVYENYLAIDDKYLEFFKDLSQKQGISYNFDGDYTCIDYMGAYLMHNTTFNYVMESYPRSEDPILYFLNTAREGTARHYASATTLWFRSLGIPARYVQGYISYAQSNSTVVVNALQSHSWTEIYIDGIGWYQVDLSINCLSKEMLMYMFYGTDLSQIEIDDYGKKVLTKIEAIPDETEKTFFIGDVFTYNLLKVYAYYDDGTERKVIPTKVFKPKTDTKGTKTVTVIYNEGDYTEYATYTIEVVEPEIIGIELDTRNVQTVFYKGDTFNNDNLIILLLYSNGKKVRYDGPYDISFVDDAEDPMLIVGKHTVEVSVTAQDKEFIATYKIDVYDSGVKGVQIYSTYYDKFGEKERYDINGELAVDYLVISLIYSTGSSKEIPFDSTSMKIVGFNSSKSGEREYYLLYTNDEGVEIKSNSLGYLIDQVKDVKITSLRVTNEYSLHENFSYGELEIELNYLSGKREFVSFNDENMVIEGFSTKKTGTYKYHLVYTDSEGKKHTSNEIEYVVPGIDKVEFSASVTKYYLNEDFDTSSITVTIKYTNGSSIQTYFDPSCMELVGFDSSKPTDKGSCYIVYTDDEGNTYDSNKIKYIIKDLPTISILKKLYEYDYGVLKYDTLENDILKNISGKIEGDDISLSFSENFDDYRLARPKHSITVFVSIFRNGVNVVNTKYKDSSSFTITLKVSRILVEVTTYVNGYGTIYTNNLEQFYVYENEKKIDLGTMNYPDDFLTCATVDGDEIIGDWDNVKPTKGNRVVIMPKSYQFFHDSINVTKKSYQVTNEYYATLIYE